jgi:hypothetical protein
MPISASSFRSERPLFHGSMAYLSSEFYVTGPPSSRLCILRPCATKGKAVVHVEPSFVFLWQRLYIFFLCPKNRHTNNKTWTIIPTLNPNLGGSLRVYVHPWNLLVQYFFISFSVPCSRYLNSRKCTLLKGTPNHRIAPTGKTPTPRSTPSCIFIQDPSRRRSRYLNRIVQLVFRINKVARNSPAY